MKISRCFILWIAILLLPAVAEGFDAVLHSDVVYTAAIANGFDSEDAGLIADASQSLDDNDSTSAFSWRLIGREAADRASGSNNLDRLPHMISGQVFHALAGSKVREIVEEEHLKRIAHARAEIGKAGSDAARQQRKRLALLYLGEYLHFLADTVVHPDDPLLGHLKEGHDPDRGDRHPQSVRIATSLISRQLGLYKKELALVKTSPGAEIKVPNRLHDDPEKDRFLEEVADTVTSSWRRTYPDKLPWLLKKPDSVESTALRLAVGSGQSYSTYTELWDQARKARAHSEIARVVKRFRFSAPEHVYRKIELDESGDPSYKQEHRFGSVRKPDTGAFAKTLADDKILSDERSRNAGIQTIRAMGAALKTLSLPTQISSELLRDARKAAVWRPPTGPGGIALDPGLVMPKGIGKPVRITMDGAALVLVTSSGRYVFEDIDPRSFATLARTVASGEIPFVTIGTTPSDRDGYARVLYSPSLIGTWEGSVLYDSDVLFKAVFSRFPFGPEYVFNRPESELYSAFPGAGGESMRMWITSRRVVLENRGGALVPAQHGIRILSETILDRRTQKDHELETYAAKLTAYWDRLSESIWPFIALEDMARATAIVFWARSESVPIDPLILTLPSRLGYTPSHAPIVGVLGNENFGAAGGVALTPEEKSTTSGRLFLNLMRSAVLAPNRQEEHPILVTSLLVLSFAALALGFMFVCSLLLWGVCRLCAYPRMSRGRALRLWTLACVAGFILAMAACPLVREGGPLSFFDADMLAFFVTTVAFPFLLFALLSRLGRGEDSPSARLGESKQRAPVARLLLVALGLLGPVCNTILSLALALATAAVSQPVSGPVMNTVLTYELAPADVWAQGLFSLAAPTAVQSGKQGVDSQPGFFLLPRSLLYSQRSPFADDSRIPSSHPKEITNADPGRDPNLPFTTLRRITWPDDMPLPGGLTHYSPDGSAPFEWGSPKGRVEHARVNRFEILGVVDSPSPNAREVIHKEGDFSETLWVETRPLLGDSDFVRAEMSEVGNSFWVNIVLSPVGREKFAEVTRAFVGRRLAVFVLGKLVIAPRVATPIEGGVVQIVGNMSEAEAGRIVKALNRK